MRRFLLRERAGRNLPPALPFEEGVMRRSVRRDASPSAFTGPQPALCAPHPDVVVPRSLPYHTPVWDALVWRFVQRVEPTGCSQEAHLLRNYLTHSEPLEPLQPALAAAAGALSIMSLHSPAVATVSAAVPLVHNADAVSGDAPVAVDATDGGAAGGDCDSNTSFDQDFADYKEWQEARDLDFDGDDGDAPDMYGDYMFEH